MQGSCLIKPAEGTTLVVGLTAEQNGWPKDLYYYYYRYSPIDCESQSRKEISLGSENKEKVAQKIHSNKAFPQISNKESDGTL